MLTRGGHHPGQIDSDGSGLIEWPEFVALIARIKRGDSALRAFSKMFEVMQSSPVNVVEQQAKARDVAVSYKQIEV